MAYTTETKVYDRTGFTSARIQSLTSKSSEEVTTYIGELISDAEQRIREDIGYPIRIDQERHFGDGSKNIFELGPEDDPYAEEGDYDPENNLIEVYNVWSGRLKRRKPYPEDCELGTESITGWTGTSTISADITHNVHDDTCIKVIFGAANQTAQYPDGSTVMYLDKIVDTWSDLFFYAKTTDATATFTVRLYDKDGNYAYQIFTLRQSNVGQYIFLDLNTFTDLLDWNSVRVQYIVFLADKGCTLYIDNMCFADDWAFSAPSGLFHISVADNIPTESSPSYGYPFFVSYGYDPFLGSVPRNISEAAEWMVGMYLIDMLRGNKYQELDFELRAETLEANTPFQRGGLLGIRTNMEKSYWRCISRWGGGAYGMV